MNPPAKRARIGECAECTLRQPLDQLVKCPKCGRWICSPWQSNCGIVHAKRAHDVEIGGNE